MYTAIPKKTYFCYLEVSEEGDIHNRNFLIRYFKRNNMRKSIYEIALECQYCSSHIKIGCNSHKIMVEGDIVKLKSLLIKLCDLIFNKYPNHSATLRQCVNCYENNIIKYQTIIDALIEVLIICEKPTINSKKFFISHASSDKVIIEAFNEKILMLGCGFKREDIFCTLDHTVIHNGDDFRNAIIHNMKDSDFILCFLSNNYKKSEVCQNEMGAAWALSDKMVRPYKFPNVAYSELGFLAQVKQTADITDMSKLDELYQELCRYYSLQQDWINFNKQKNNFVNFVTKSINTNEEIK